VFLFRITTKRDDKMSKLILISGKKFCKILEKMGFEKVYGKGSHVRFNLSKKSPSFRWGIQTESYIK